MSNIRDFTGKNRKFTGTDSILLPKGTAAQRVGSASGELRFNTETNLAEYYNGTIWKAIDSPPIITSIDITEVDSNAGGNQTIVITGSNFQSGVTVVFEGNAGVNLTPTTVTRDSSNQITTVTPKSSFLNAQEPYGVKVTNVSGLSATLANQINVDTAPSWTTASGSLGSVESGGVFSATVVATDADSDTISYSITTGSLPAGLSLNSSTGAITGTATSVGATTTSNFTLRATANTKTADRAFSITVTATNYFGDGSDGSLDTTP